jgi:sugar/nucleoside kinase (ribokinase family)
VEKEVDEPYRIFYHRTEIQRREVSVARVGITGAGNFIIDRVKTVDLWPEEGMLSLILEEKMAGGGCAYNVLKDLAILKTGLPLQAVGLTSNDADGSYIFRDLEEHGIDSSMMHVIDGVITSYTDVITVRKTGNRTFFHNKGTNKYLDIEHFDFTRITTKILHIGYILLLDTLDGPDPEYGTRMARLLRMAKDSGLKTSVDVVSESSFRFNKIVLPALRYTDYLIINEIEAGRTTGYEIRERSGKLNVSHLKEALRMLLAKGESELVCIHFPEGAYAALKGEAPVFAPSCDLPEGYIVGTAGAGDAFCAGMLYGIYEEWELEKCMGFANAMAGICLAGLSTSDSMKSLDETLRFVEEMPLRKMTI